MLDPACRGGRLISPKPACGPEDSSRRSLQIFDSLMALRFSDARERHERARVARGLDEVGRRLEAEPGDRVQVAHGGGAVTRVGRDARADRGGAEVDLGEQPDGLGEARVILAEGRREAVELLAEGHRHGVLQLGAPDLEDLVELLGLAAERLAQQLELGEQRVQREGERDLERRRVGVVRRLAAVHVVDGVQDVVAALGVAGDLERDVGDDLVGVHVRRGAGAALDDADHELVVELAVDDALAGPVDPHGLVGVQHADFAVRPRRGLLHRGERTDQVGVHRDGALGDREVLERAHGVHAPVGVGRHLDAAERVGLGPRLGRKVDGVRHVRLLLGDQVVGQVFGSGHRHCLGSIASCARDRRAWWFARDRRARSRLRAYRRRGRANGRRGAPTPRRPLLPG